MSFAKNMKTLLLITLLLANSSCNMMTKIPNVRFYSVIPFQDCPELVYIESLTKKGGRINCEDSKKIIPTLLSVDPTGKEQIFQQWSEACRYANKDGKKKCNVELESIRKHVETIDSIARKLIPKP